MSARRAARSREPVADFNGVPAPLALGKCLEVWSPSEKPELYEAWRRYGRARMAWAKAAGLDSVEMHRLVPDGAPWSASFELGRERLARAGFGLNDLPRLRDLADNLVPPADIAEHHHLGAAHDLADL